MKKIIDRNSKSGNKTQRQENFPPQPIKTGTAIAAYTELCSFTQSMHSINICLKKVRHYENFNA